MHKQVGETSAARMSRAFAWLMSGLTAVIVSATVGAVGAHLIQNKHQDARDLMTTLQKSFADNKPDWDYWRDTANINMHTTFVRVTVRPKAKPVRRYYTRRTKHFLKHNWDYWFLTRHILYRDDLGIYYHSVKKEVVDHATVTYELWLSLNNMLALFKLIFGVVVAVSLVALILGLLAIRVLARRLNQPLAALTGAATAITEAQDVTYHETLPVPQSPREVQVLGTEFNRLLQSLNRQVIRDHQFVSDASHELRTPLAAIRGHVGLIRRHATAHPEVVPESLATIDAESLKMQKLIERLLHLSRMDHAHLDLVACDLRALAQRVLATYPTTSAIALDAPTPVTAMANADSVEQIVVALLNNAVKYAGAPITLRVRQTPTGATIAVVDRGVGVADADKAKVFDRFYRVDASREKQIGGTGLGLAIAQRLAALNQGELVVRDNHPTGAIFELILSAI